MDHLLRQLRPYASRGLLLDTNILLLYGVGLFNRQMITSFKRTRAYTAEDFGLVSRCVDYVSRIITTPHILTEFSNLGIRDKDGQNTAFCQSLIEVIRRTKEIYVAKDAIVKTKHLQRLGVTDTAIIQVTRESRCIVLTDDLPLFGILRSSQCAAINLNHLRTRTWFA